MHPPLPATQDGKLPLSTTAQDAPFPAKVIIYVLFSLPNAPPPQHTPQLTPAMLGERKNTTCAPKSCLKGAKRKKMKHLASTIAQGKVLFCANVPADYLALT